MALSSTDVQYIESEAEREEKRLNAASASSPTLLHNGIDVVIDSNVANFDVFKASKLSNRLEHSRSVGDATKPTPPPRHSLMTVQRSSRDCSPSSSSTTTVATIDGMTVTRRTPSPADGRKPSFFQKWFKGDPARRASSPSQSPPLQRKPVPQHINKDIPPELQGVSVKELVKVIGESRANGNGVTPPGTPASQRRMASGRLQCQRTNQSQ